MIVFIKMSIILIIKEKAMINEQQAQNNGQIRGSGLVPESGNVKGQTWSSKEELALGIWVYHDVLPKELDLINAAGVRLRRDRSLHLGPGTLAGGQRGRFDRGGSERGRGSRGRLRRHRTRTALVRIRDPRDRVSTHVSSEGELEDRLRREPRDVSRGLSASRDAVEPGEPQSDLRHLRSPRALGLPHHRCRALGGSARGSMAGHLTGQHHPHVVPERGAVGNPGELPDVPHLSGTHRR